MLIRRIITSDLCTAVDCQQFAKNQENFKGELCLNVITPFTIIVVVLPLRDVNSNLNKPKWGTGAQAVVRGHGSPWPPVATALPTPRRFLRKKVLLKKKRWGKRSLNKLLNLN